MRNLSDINTIKELLRKHGFTFSKALGQNFIIDPNICPQMAEMCGADSGVGVIEIGSGIGVLTTELAQRADKVVCIELDQRLLPILNETLSDFNNITIINEDVLKVDLLKLIEEQFSGLEVVVCANLPYYITSPIIMNILEAKLPVKSITVMVQKEAAGRLCAEAGTREVGAVTIAVRYYSEPQILFGVDRTSFMPSPDVDSSVIKFDILPTPPIKVNDEKIFFKVVKAAFAQRRKTLNNTLSSSLGMSKQEIADILEKAELKPTSRAEELSMEQFATLANLFAVL
ncbi:MAG: 16S rRNA (adenine(1518)-N(6)/adenine(1519)-N(6))-dimethyltransferase RsmA [Oscillospiraceae bacterium]